MSKKSTRAIQEVLDSAEKDMDRFLMETISNLKKATPKASGYASKQWKAKKADLTKNNQKGVITNNTDYIEALNQGHSKQARAGFVESTIQNTIRKFK